MSQVPTTNINALYTNTTTGTVASPTIMDAAIQDIVATINTNDSTLIPTAKIALLAITTALLADGSVTSAKILDGTITTGDIADLAITVAKIADGAITSAKILDGTIMNADINAAAAIDAAKIGPGTVSNAEFGYLDGVTGPIQQQLTNATLGAIADGSITDVKLDNGATSVKAKANAAVPKDSPQFTGLVKSTNNTLDDGTGAIISPKTIRLGDSVGNIGAVGLLPGNGGGWYWIDGGLAGGGIRFSGGGAPGGTLMASLDSVGNATIAGALTAGAGGSFANSKAANGYQKLPGGLIMQWGSATIASGALITFPIAFPTAVTSITATCGAASPVATSANSPSPANVPIYHGNGATATLIYWMAIGY